MEMSVVEELCVVRIGATVQQQTRKFVSLRMRRSIVFAFSRNSAKRRITMRSLADFEVIVRIRAVIE